MSQLQLYADLASRKLVSSDGGTPTLFPFVLGDTITFSLRVLERADSGLRERRLNVRTVQASLGKVMDPPASGSFRLKAQNPAAPGWHNGAAINFDADATAVNTAVSLMIAPLGWTVAAAQAPAPGCWLVKLAGVAAPPAQIALLSNALAPTAFVRIRPFQLAGEWWHEIRMIVAPLAWNEAGHERVLPSPPSVRRIRAGFAETSSLPPVNELQALHLPSDFRGTYFLRWNDRASSIIGIDAVPDDIATALDGMFPDSAQRFTATNPEADEAYLEFTGPLAGAPQPLITVEVNTFEPGVLTFSIPLKRSDLCTALRAATSITVPFEVQLEIVEDDEDAEDPGIPGKVLTLFQQPVTIVREQIFEELAAIQDIDWVHPATPRDYIPFTPDQVITGSQHYTASFGDGTATEFSFVHNLGTEAGHVTIRENASDGRKLEDSEFDLSYPSANEIVVVLAYAPAVNALAITFTTAGPRDAFQAHTHTMAQVIGLLDALAALSARVTTIEGRLPFTDPAVPAVAGGGSIEIVTPDFADVFPGRFSADYDPKTALPPKRLGALFPAVHVAAATDFAGSGALPDFSTLAGQAYHNTGPAFLLTGGFGHRSVVVPAGGFVASDGRAWFLVNREGATKSYFPADMERELFMFFVNEQMLRAGKKLDVEFQLALRTLRATTRAEFILKVEHGTAPQDTSPATTAVNLQNIVWNATPLIAQRLILSGTPQVTKFGVAVRRFLDDSLAADQLLYNTWTAAGSAPASANFALRARLVQFDTENSVTGAKGALAVALTEGLARIA